MSSDPTDAQRVPLARPWTADRERELVMRVLDSDVLALGPFADEFGVRVARLAGRHHGVACSSGTAGLHMAVRALGIGDGDEVVTTPFSFIASTNCLLYERARPVFVDIEDDSLGLDPGRVEDAIGPRTRAILPVHVFGRPCRIADIVGAANRRGLRLIEDSCEALGSTKGGRPMGSYGDVSVFAFYPNKQITTGEGGVVVTDDDDIALTIRSLRNQGRDTDGTWLRHVQLGYNYRLDEISAAIGVAQLDRYEELRAGRARVAARYAEVLGSVEDVRLPTAGPQEDIDWFVYVVRLEPSVDRQRVMEDMAKRGVPSRPYFAPLHLQPFLRDTFGFRPGDFPVTERVAATTLALPFSARLTDDEVAHVASALVDAIGGRRRG
jgi:perosamine synthetase